MRLATGRIYYAEDHPTIDWKKLAYFALSVFWRGAADSWERRKALHRTRGDPAGASAPVPTL
jgi:hypothetical protein